MSLYFITGNKNKFEEARAILGSVKIKQLDIDLPEIQSLDSKEIVKVKLLEALEHAKGGVVVEDASLSMACLNGLPGPFIKWFCKTIGIRGLANIAKRSGNNKAGVRLVVGYAKNPKEMYFFESRVRGKIVLPRGKTTFVWDPIFQPAGHTKTYAEMGLEEKNKISHRRIAFDKLRKFLQNKTRYGI